MWRWNSLTVSSMRAVEPNSQRICGTTPYGSRASDSGLNSLEPLVGDQAARELAHYVTTSMSMVQP